MEERREGSGLDGAGARGIARGGGSVPGDAGAGLGRRRDEVVGIVAGLAGVFWRLLGLHLLGNAMSPQRKRRLSQQDLRALGVQPGLLATRYPAGGDRAQIQRLTAETTTGRRFEKRLTSNSNDSNLTGHSERGD
jgi:hypothetical protein